MSETHVAHPKVLSRMQSLSESPGGSKVTKPIGINFWPVALVMQARQLHSSWGKFVFRDYRHCGLRDIFLFMKPISGFKRGANFPGVK